jgi:hypothetical protein
MCQRTIILGSSDPDDPLWILHCPRYRHGAGFFIWYVLLSCIAPP